MNKDNVAKLIAALRSNEYKQATGTLRDTARYCCLGVACDISGLGQWEHNTSSGGWKYVVRNEDGLVIGSDSSVLPVPVANWLGISQDGTLRLPVPEYACDVRLGTEEEDYLMVPTTELTDLNDSGLSFAQIADILENADTFEWAATPKLPENDDNDEV